MGRFGHLTGLGPLHAPQHVELLPYALAKGRYRDAPTGHPFEDGTDHSRRSRGPQVPDHGQPHPRRHGESRFRPGGSGSGRGESHGNRNILSREAPLLRGARRALRLRPDVKLQLLQYSDHVPRAAHRARAPAFFLRSPLWLRHRPGPGDDRGRGQGHRKDPKRMVRRSARRGDHRRARPLRGPAGRGAEGVRGAAHQPRGREDTARAARRQHDHRRDRYGRVRDLSDDALSDLLRSHAYVAGADFNHYWAGRRVVGGRLSAREPDPGKPERDRSRAALERPILPAPRRGSPHVRPHPDAPRRQRLAGLAQQAGRQALAGNADRSGHESRVREQRRGLCQRCGLQRDLAIVLYKENQPSKLFRNWNAFAFTNHAFNYAGDLTYQGYEAQANATFANYWAADFRGSSFPKAYDDRLTRGGPLAAIPPGGRVAASLVSDSRKNYLFSGHVDYGWNDAGAHSARYSPSLTLHPTPSMLVRLEPSIQTIRDMAQYVATVPDPNAATFGTGTSSRRWTSTS